MAEGDRRRGESGHFPHDTLMGGFVGMVWMPAPGVGILVSPVRRKNPLPPPSAVSIRVLQGKRFQQCNVASAFLQILFELYTDILDVQSEPGLDRDGRWKQRVIAWEKFGADGRACPPEPRRSRHRLVRRGFGLTGSARSPFSSLLGRRPKPVQALHGAPIFR
jgi:hypothetical protein